jgi:hypothetical protein
MKSFVLKFLAFLSVIFLFTTCSKEPGQGGLATITGKVYVKDYNSTFTVLYDEYYGNDVYVYIIYGDDVDYSDKIKTSYNGVYEFKYLREGTYHVYAYSKDSTLQTTNPIGIVQEVKITKKKQTVNVPDLVVFN